MTFWNIAGLVGAVVMLLGICQGNVLFELAGAFLVVTGFFGGVE